MGIRVALNHTTHYKYDKPVTIEPHIVRLKPAPHCRTPILAYSLAIEPKGHFINWQQDIYGNHLARLVFPELVTEFKMTVDLIADLTTINPFDFFLEEHAENYPFDYDKEMDKGLEPYLTPLEEKGEHLSKWLEGVDHTPRRTIDFLVDLNARLAGDIKYSVRMEPGVQTPEQTLERGVGSCRDTGWLLVEILRHLGFGARFVSGYLVQLKPDQESLDGPSGTAEDFTDLHAWCEVYIPGAGWMGMDPTSGLFAGEGHIPLAGTPSPPAAAPVTGVILGDAECDFTFSNTVERIIDDPRVTKPYSDEQWDAIQALGDQVEEDLQAGGVKLTMGGEPTFVSIDDMESAQWNIDADGQHKRERAWDLAQRFQKRFAEGGLLQYGEGKWYPGEPLPRWTYRILWRKDGTPIWHDPKRLADIHREGTYSFFHAEHFAQTLAENLAIDGEHVFPAYEDPFYYAWKEDQLPVEEDPLKRDLEDPLERQYLSRLLDGKLGKPAGYTLPLRWIAHEDRWETCRWKFRRNHLFLTPGGSAIGLRLPLDSIKGPDAGDESRDERSPFEPTEPLRSRPTPKHPPHVADFPFRTALSVEARNGRLYVFLPPMEQIEPFLHLVSAVEATAEKLDVRVVLEGYPAPYDNRMDSIQVTPDPGVIEVNIHPAKDWRTIVKNTEIIYEEARLARLGTEKFMLDGRHTGTGGGNHVTLGGASPSESPFLRRPGLLRSLLTYWQHHPALSYLFSGTFIGPTSQAPRFDEGRPDRIHEMEIAFSQLPDGDAETPWQVDRILRNLLTDLTGNTHRAEFCIDKLFSPDSTTGRLGILELRGFEMPPHSQMSLVQVLLIRALIARFWDEPYHKPLVRWGNELHDKWMLPHFIWQDVQDICGDLKRSGYEFDEQWFAPFFEFRFPKYGTVSYGGVNLTVRFAIEPWIVLGEEATGQGTARYVDSSVERVQIRVSGLTDERHTIACNGRVVRLRPTGIEGEYVAGIRYKAWNPYSALHPTIPIQTPLVFDIVDLWVGRSIGGCRYHVAHPGGRSYDTIPVNAMEAEARRTSRFWEDGHTPTGGYTGPAILSQETAPEEEDAEPAKKSAADGMNRTFQPLNGGSGLMASELIEGPPEFPLTFDLRKS